MRSYFLPHLVTDICVGLIVLGCPPGDPMDDDPIPDAADRFFVDAARGDDTNAGRRAAPLQSIQEGIDRAALSGGSVYVAGGTYHETIFLASAVELHGGYDASGWTRDIENFPSIITGSDDSIPTTTIVGDAAISVLFEGFTVMTPDATTAEQSPIAVSLHDCDEIMLRNTTIFSGNGATGPNGFDGPDQLPGASGSDGADAAACGGSIPGGAGGDTFNVSAFAGGRGGSGNLGAGSNGEGASGAAPEIALGGLGGAGGGVGGDGAPGTSGHDSTLAGDAGLGGSGAGSLTVALQSDGDPAKGGPTFSTAVYVPAEGMNGRIGLHGGPGGGGGGGGGGIVFACGASGGGGGGPGRGGNLGGGGGGGGASIGIIITNSTAISISNCDLATGDGGEGGVGGDGGSPGPVGLGGRGGARFGGQGAGGNGGTGGAGAPGGAGGGGGGGPVFGIAHDADSTVTLSDNTFDLGTPGEGGMSPAGPDFFGATGLAMDVFEFDDGSGE